MSPDDTSRENGWKGSYMAFDWMGAIGAGAGLIDTIVNGVQQHKAMEYNKDLQERIFQREDNSVQRKMADVQAAGLSKTLAVGGPGAGAGAAVDIGRPPQLDIGEKAKLGIELRQRKIENDFQARNLDIAQQDANTRSIEADTHAKEVEARSQLIGKQAALAEQQTFYSQKEQELLQNRLDNYPLEISSKSAQRDSELARAALYAAQSGHYEKLDAELAARMPNIEKQGKLLSWQIVNAADEHDIHLDKAIAQKLQNSILEAGVKGADLDNAGKAVDNAIREYERDYMKTHGTKVPTATSWMLGFANALLTQGGNTAEFLAKEVEQLIAESSGFDTIEEFKKHLQDFGKDAPRGGGKHGFW